MKRTLYLIILIALFLVAITTPAQAKEYTVESVPNVQVVNRNEYVTDPDNYLGNEAKNKINTMLSQLRDSNSVETAIVVLPSIGNDDIDDFATRLFTHWGIGKASNDNGLLIIAVMDQRQVVFRTGYGIEGVLPDVLCSRIIREYIIPSFRQGEYGRGMTQAVEQTLHIIMTPEASSELLAVDNRETRGIDEEDKAILLTLLYCYVILSLIISFLLTIRLNRTIKQYKSQPYECYKELNSSLSILIITAIFFPIWCAFVLARCKRTMKQMREMPRQCPQCNAAMQRLSEEEDNYYLTPQEDAEERIGSVDYDVWLCKQCNDIEVFRFDQNNTKYQECPYCHAKTYSLTHDHIVTPATTLSAGKGEKVYNCYYCKARKVVPYIIPMIVVPKSGSGGGGSSFGGGFGGGMTGGGGARGGW